MDELEILRRRLEREKAARRAAESFIESKSLELYTAQEKRQEAFEALQRQIEATEAMNLKLQEEVLWHTMAESFEADRRHLLERIARGHALEGILQDLKLMAEDELPGGRCAVFLDPGQTPGGPPEARAPQAIQVIEDLQKDPFWSAHAREMKLEGYTSCWSRPILSWEGAIAGRFAMGFRGLRRPGDLDTHTFEALCGLAELALGHRQMLEALIRQARQDALSGTGGGAAPAQGPYPPK